MNVEAIVMFLMFVAVTLVGLDATNAVPLTERLIARIGALDTPVPYSPSLEDAFLPGEAVIAQAARRLVQY